jgi:hypothetical protein
MMDTPIFPNYIDGQWIDSGAHFENRNPADTDHIVGLFVKGTAGDIADAAATPPPRPCPLGESECPGARRHSLQSRRTPGSPPRIRSPKT